MMISRDELLKLLGARLQERLSPDEISRLANEVLELQGGWEEMDISHRDLGYSHSDACSSICWLADQTEQGSVIKMYRKKKEP
jgi:hypothetical protein